MAYVFSDRRVWGVDAVGIVSHRPVWLRSAVFYPDAIGDSITFKSWNPQGKIGSAEHFVLDNYANPPLDGKASGNKRTYRAPLSEKYRVTASMNGSTNKLTSTGNFTAALVGTPPSIMRILYTEDATQYRTGAGPGGGGLGGYLLVVTRNTDNKITVATGGGTLSNEASKEYSWWIVMEDSDMETAFVIKALKTGGSDTIVQGAVMYDFGENGKWFPNLACTSLSTSSSIDLYLK